MSAPSTDIPFEFDPKEVISRLANRITQLEVDKAMLEAAVVNLQTLNAAKQGKDPDLLPSKKD